VKAGVEERNPAHISGGTGYCWNGGLTTDGRPGLLDGCGVHAGQRDGGEHFEILGTGREKHSDNHVPSRFDPQDDFTCWRVQMPVCMPKLLAKGATLASLPQPSDCAVL
jgi:hypothetical protein